MIWSGFLVALVYYASLFLVFNIKTLILTAVGTGLILFYWVPETKGKIRESLFYTMLLVLPFEKGVRGFNVEIVTAMSRLDLPGYSQYFGLSLKLIMAGVLMILAMKDRLIEGKWWWSKGKDLWILVVMMLWGLLGGVIQGKQGLVFWSGMVRWLYIGSLYLLGRKFINGKKNKKMFEQIITASLLFEGIIGSWQFLTGGVLGLSIESTAQTVPFGRVTYENKLLFRVPGTTGHPTFLGSILAVWIPIVVAGLIEKVVIKKQKWQEGINLFRGAAVVLGGIAIFGTYSRSAWFAGVAGVLGVVFLLRDKFHWGELVKKYWWIGGIGIVFLGLFSSQFLLRLSSVQNIFEVGTGRDRWLLVKEAVAMIKEKPLFGVGLNRFTKVLVNSQLTKVGKSFLFPVHNTFLLVAAEVGLPALLLWLGLIIKVLLERIKKGLVKPVMIGVWMGAVSFMFSGQFHTLFAQDASLDYFMIMLGMLARSNK